MTKKEFLFEVGLSGGLAISKCVSAGIMLMAVADQDAKRRLEMFDYLAEKLRSELAKLGVETPPAEVLRTYAHGVMSYIPHPVDGEPGK